MSIIHEALKKSERAAAGETPVDAAAAPAETPAAPAPSPSARESLWPPALLGAGGVFLAALITYLATRPPDIRVVTPTALSASAGMPAAPMSTETSRVEPRPGAAAPRPGAVAGLSPLDTALPPDLIEATVPTTTTTVPMPIMVEEPINAGVTPIRITPTEPVVENTAPATTAPPATVASTTVPPQPLLRVSTDLRRPDEAENLPPDAVTIEMANAQLESLFGSVTVNGQAARPGEAVRIGSSITTGASSGAALTFERANVDIGQNASARITRLERRSTAEGQRAEEVTLHLQSGELRSLVHPGQGSVLVSTDQAIITSSSGAFVVKANADRSVTVTGTAGQLKVVPRTQPGETLILGPNESLVFKDGQWTRQ